jgi:hypothetical protein
MFLLWCGFDINISFNMAARATKPFYKLNYSKRTQWFEIYLDVNDPWVVLYNSVISEIQNDIQYTFKLAQVILKPDLFLAFISNIEF